MTPSGPGTELARARPVAELGPCHNGSSLNSRSPKDQSRHKTQTTLPLLVILSEDSVVCREGGIEGNNLCRCNEFLQAAELVAAKRFSDTMT